MINYTERITVLMQDVVERTPRLSFIDLREVVVFGRFGRTDAEGAFATCHCLTLPESEPGYYFWRDRSTGELTRRSEWFVTKSPQVRVGGTEIKYLISFVLPRFCDQSLEHSRKIELYPQGTPSWIAKLDTIVHELYHIDPDESGIRRVSRSDGSDSPRSHGPLFYEEVAAMVKGYIDSKPDPRLYDFLQEDFQGLTARHRGVVATTFRNFPFVSAALHGAGEHAGWRSTAQGRTAQAADSAGAVHRRRLAHPPIYRWRRQAAHPKGAAQGGVAASGVESSYSTRLIPTNRSVQ